MQSYDAIVIGSGFAGAMAARQLVQAGEGGPHVWVMRTPRLGYHERGLKQLRREQRLGRMADQRV